MNPELTKAFRAAKARASALKSVGRDDDYIADSLLKLPNMPQEAKDIIKNAKAEGKSSKIISDINEIPIADFDSPTTQKEDFEVDGKLGSVSRFLGMEKAGRRIGSTLANLDPQHRRNLESIGGQEAEIIRTGGVNNREFAGSLASTALNIGLPGAKALTGASKLGKVGQFASRTLGATGTGARVAKGMGTGAAFGVAGALGDDQKGGELVQAGILGGVVGGAFSGAGAVLGNYRESLKNISPQLKNVLEKAPNENKLNKYINSAKARSLDLEQTAPFGVAAKELESAGSILKKKISKAGKQVSTTKQAVRDVPLKDVGDVLSGFQNSVAERFGLNLTKSGNKIVAKKIKGSLREISPTERNRIIDAYKQLNKLQKSGKVGGASDVVSNLDDIINYNKISAQFGSKIDPIESLIKSTRGKINDVIKGSSKELATANKTFSELKDLDKFVGSMAGKELNRGELLIRRVFSGDKSREAVDIFQKLKKVTGKDLIEDAALAKFAIENYGDDTSKTLLTQIIEGGAQQALSGRLPGAELVGSLAKKIGGAGVNPAKAARELIKPSKVSQNLGGARRTLGQAGYNTISRIIGGF